MGRRTKRSRKWPSLRDKAKLARDERFQSEEHKTWRLIKAVLFEHNITLDPSGQPEIIALLERLMQTELAGKVGAKRVSYFETILANVVRSSGKPIRLPMDVHKWMKMEYRKIPYPFIKEILPKMEKEGLIEMKVGYRFPNDSKISRIVPTNKLLDLLKGFSIRIVEYPPLVVIKNSLGKPMDWPRCDKIRGIERLLERTNRVNRDANVRDRQGKPLETHLHAVFNVFPDKGGRMYGCGGFHYLSAESHTRKKITIAGEPVVEYDFGSYYPRLLYVMQGIQYPLDEDPYMIIPEMPQLRGLFKLVLLCVLATDGKVNAVKAGNNDLRTDPGSHSLLKACDQSVSTLIDLFEEKHKPISHYFYKKMTGTMQYRDSQVARLVLHHFIEQDIPCLPVHDSFIVPEQYEGELIKTMDKAFESNTGGFKCPVSPK